MDRELETYVDKVMDEQKYRSGIFSTWIDIIVGSMADFRATPNIRGSYGIRGGK